MTLTEVARSCNWSAVGIAGAAAAADGAGAAAPAGGVRALHVDLGDGAVAEIGVRAAYQGGGREFGLGRPSSCRGTVGEDVFPVGLRASVVGGFGGADWGPSAHYAVYGDGHLPALVA